MGWDLLFHCLFLYCFCLFILLKTIWSLDAEELEGDRHFLLPMLVSWTCISSSKNWVRWEEMLIGTFLGYITVIFGLSAKAASNSTIFFFFHILKVNSEALTWFHKSSECWVSPWSITVTPQVEFAHPESCNIGDGLLCKRGTHVICLHNLELCVSIYAWRGKKSTFTKLQIRIVFQQELLTKAPRVPRIKPAAFSKGFSPLGRYPLVGFWNHLSFQFFYSFF